jgi:hypothetical protein
MTYQIGTGGRTSVRTIAVRRTTCMAVVPYFTPTARDPQPRTRRVPERDRWLDASARSAYATDGRPSLVHRLDVSA